MYISVYVVAFTLCGVCMYISMYVLHNIYNALCGEETEGDDVEALHSQLVHRRLPFEVTAPYK